ncbi:MAG TPA: trigger factor [Negativicutes bacterium]|nr:trigger factor [Negativicutes bacterium]
MKVNAEKIDKYSTVLEIEVDAAEVNRAFDRAFQKLAQKVNVPGFRKGKAPRKVLETRLGKEAVAQEAMDFVLPETYGAALQEVNLVPVDRPKLDLSELEENKSFSYKATVIGKPEVKLGEYKGIKVEKPVHAITDEMILEELAGLQQRHAKVVVMEGAALNNGDFAILDFEGFIDGEAFKGGKAESYPLEIGSGSFIPGFEEQLIGAKAGEQRIVKTPFPADYFVPDLAGKEAEFHVTVKDVKRKELPALDDDFAKEASEFATLEELKADVKNKLEEKAAARAEREYNDSVMQKVAENAEVDIPEVMAEQRASKMLNDFTMNLRQRGLSLENYLEHANITVAQMKERYMETAKVEVKRDLVLEAIAKAENIEVAETDIQAEIERIAVMYQTTPKQVLDILVSEQRLGDVRFNLLLNKTFKVIMDQAAAV